MHDRLGQTYSASISCQNVCDQCLRVYKWDPRIAGPPKQLLTHERLQLFKFCTQACKQQSDVMPTGCCSAAKLPSGLLTADCNAVSFP